MAQSEVPRVNQSSGRSRSESFHSINDRRGEQCEGMPILLRVVQTNGEPIPSHQLTRSQITLFCYRELEMPPESISILNDTEVILHFDIGQNVVDISRKLHRATRWNGVPVQLGVVMCAHENTLREISDSRQGHAHGAEGSLGSTMDITGREILTPEHTGEENGIREEARATTDQIMQSLQDRIDQRVRELEERIGNRSQERVGGNPP